MLGHPLLRNCPILVAGYVGLALQHGHFGGFSRVCAFAVAGKEEGIDVLAL